jgi:hypothetical protein
VEVICDAITIKPTVVDLREEGKWQELELISDHFLVSKQAVVDISLFEKKKSSRRNYASHGRDSNRIPPSPGYRSRVAPFFNACQMLLNGI